MTDDNNPDVLEINEVAIDPSTITLETGTHTWVSGEDEYSLTYAGYIEVEEDALVFIMIENGVYDMTIDGMRTNLDTASIQRDENDYSYYWAREDAETGEFTPIDLSWPLDPELLYDSAYMPDYDLILCRQDDEEALQEEP